MAGVGDVNSNAVRVNSAAPLRTAPATAPAQAAENAAPIEQFSKTEGSLPAPITRHIGAEIAPQAPALLKYSSFNANNPTAVQFINDPEVRALDINLTDSRDASPAEQQNREGDFGLSQTDALLSTRWGKDPQKFTALINDIILGDSGLEFNVNNESQYRFVEQAGRLNLPAPARAFESAVNPYHDRLRQLQFQGAYNKGAASRLGISAEQVAQADFNGQAWNVTGSQLFQSGPVR